jgi:hypothetical protein
MFKREMIKVSVWKLRISRGISQNKYILFFQGLALCVPYELNMYRDGIFKLSMSPAYIAY